MSETREIANSNAGRRVPCERCAKPCVIAATRNPDARMAVEANSKNGVCAECIVTGMLKGLTGQDDRRRDPHRKADFQAFTAEGLRLPHIQEQVRAVVRSSGSRLPVDRLDFDEIAANWELPLPRSASGGLLW